MYSHTKALCENIIYSKILNPHGLEPIGIILERPKQKELGHFATPVGFVLAKSLHKSPNILAQEIAQHLCQQQEFSKVMAVSGYVNLTLSPSFLNKLCESALEGNYFSAQRKAQHSVLLEFVSANPTGPLHIGHARGAIYGDSLRRIGEFLGFKIVSEYYINDAGAQIETLGLSVFLAGSEILGKSVSYPEQYYKGLYIVDIAKAAMEKFGQKIFDDKKNIPLLSEFAKDLMLLEIKNNLKEINIEFESFVSEKALFSQWSKTLETLKMHQGIQEKEGKTWLLSSLKGDEKDRVIVRENGEPTYLAGDIIYHNNKFLRDFESYINIWGADHHGYITRLKAAIDFLGFDSSRLEILLSQMVALRKGGENYKMSKRAGNFILLKDVIADIGADALRFVFLTKSIDTHLEFDVEDLRSQDSNNPIFYINYANARIHTLLEKSAFDKTKLLQADLEKFLQKDSEVSYNLANLIFHALSLKQVLQVSFTTREIQKLCEYLKALAGDLHSFYNTYKILDTPNAAEILKALFVVSQSLTLGLHLIGITAKTKM